MTARQLNCLEIDLGAAAENLRAVRRLVGPERQIFAVLKANAYGYGTVEMAEVFVASGADALAVADLSEAVRLRQRGFAVPILLYPSSLPEMAAEVIAHGLIPTLTDLDSAEAYARAAPGPCPIFVKVDVGLERLGLPVELAVKVIRRMLELPHLRLAGICTHPHAPSGVDPAYVEWQLARFTGVIDELASQGIDVPIRMAASSPLVLRFPQSYLNAVDPGRMLYGITLADEAAGATVRPVFRTLTSRIIAEKEVMPRERFGEQAPFPVPAPMRVGVFPMGTADGLATLHAGRVLVRGRAAPLLGRPSLEHTRVDLTSVPAAHVGDEVVIIGSQGELEITTAEVARHQKIDLHHVATAVGSRVARVYLRHDDVGD
jgi:alanine racemase